MKKPDFEFEKRIRAIANEFGLKIITIKKK